MTRIVKCYDCGLAYSEFPCDFVIQDDLWYSISPTGGHGGILCPNCMCRRLSGLGMSAVLVIVHTGEIAVKNNLLTRLFNLCVYTRNRYKAWRCEYWQRKQLA